MILIPIIESMDEILNGMPKPIDRLENSQGILIEDCAGFVSRLEGVSEKYRFPITGLLSVIRGKILCGAPADPAVSLSRKDKKAAEKRYMITQLENAYNCVSEYLDGERRIISECERLVCQVSAKLAAEGALLDIAPKDISGKLLIGLAARDTELMPILAHVIGLAGAPNTNILFEKTMSLAGIIH
ncbi:MAG: hypothetical protein K2G04_07320 [Oscillospiraceae bacterium]|nr:hypothetical protein [Oscillospiraceae bacterium]